MTDGNITSTDVPTMFRVISAQLGFDPSLLFMFSSIAVLIPLSYFKPPKLTYPLVFSLYTFFGSTLGLIPSWFSIISFSFLAIFISGEFAKMLGRYSEPSTFEYHRASFITPKIELEIEPKTVNCKNCGGPNVNRTTCEYCGLVLE